MSTSISMMLAACCFLAGRVQAEGGDAAAGGESHAAVKLRLVRPEGQLGQLIGLFRGSRAADPAAALAAWKHGTGGKGSLGKPLEALIALMNPAMAPELRGLEGAELVLRFAPGSGHALWGATVPDDDGSFAALAAALALTDGVCEGQIGGATVLRVGPPGAPVSAVRDGRLALASTREELPAALDRLQAPRAPATGPLGVLAWFDPVGLRRWSSPNGRRVSAWLDAIGCAAAEGRLWLDDETLTCELTARLTPPARGAAPRPTLAPDWLDAIPAAGVVAAASAALDATPGSLDAAFAVLDRIEKADPARQNVAPIRVRLNLLAAAARVRPESDLWPVLNGITAALRVDDAGRTVGTIVALHATDSAAAGRLAREVLPRLASSYLRGRQANDHPGAGSDGVTDLGRFEGRALACTARGRHVLIGWGDGSLSVALDANAHPERSAGASIRAAWGAAGPPVRAGAFWPGRHAAAGPPDSPLARALASAPPVVWQGGQDGTTSHDVICWTGLRTVIRRWLDALPLVPPPGR